MKAGRTLLAMVLLGVVSGCAQQSVVQQPKYMNDGLDPYKEAIQEACMIEVLMSITPEDTDRALRSRYEACLRGHEVMI